MPNASFFPLFHHLSSVSPEERVASVAELTALLNQDGKAEELEYATTRLVRGLSSSRAAARQGFALGLCSLLRDNIITNPTKVFAKLQDETKTVGLKGEEERDKLLGRVFGLLALVRSERLSGEDKIQVAKALCDLNKEKSWFKDLCMFALCLLIEGESDVQILTRLGEVCVKKMEEDTLDLSSIKLALARQMGESEVDFAHINRKKLASAVAIHRERLGMIWEQLLLCAAESKEMAVRVFIELVEPMLMRGSNIPKERKSLSWRLFARLAMLQPQAVPQMLTKPLLVSCIGLKPSPMDAYEAIIHACAVTPEIQPQVVQLLLEFGDFDGKTKSKTLAALVNAGKENGSSSVMDIVDGLVNKFPVAAAADGEEGNVAVKTIDSLFDLAKMHAAAADGKVLQRVLEFFQLHGADSTTKYSALCRRRFFTLLSKTKPEDVLPLVRKFAPNQPDIQYANSKLGRTYESLVLYLSLLQQDEEEQVNGSEQIVEDLVQCAQDEGEGEDLVVLADILLALSAQPNGMLRDLVKQLTRCLASKLAESQPAIDVLMNVIVVPKKSSASDKSEEEEDDEAERENGEEEEDASSSSDDGSESEEEDEGEEITGEDEKEMEAYDRALEEMLKSRVPEKPKSKEKDQATAQALLFKLRVLDLLEIILTKTGAASLLESLPKFLQLLQDAAEQPSSSSGPGGQQANNKKKKLLAQPTNALFNRLQSIVKKLFTANGSELQASKQVLEIASGMLKKTKQEQVLKVAADSICFLAAWNDEDALELVSNQLLPLLLVGHANCKVLFTSLSVLADKTSQVELLCTKLIATNGRTQFQGELQLELLFKLLKRAVQTKSSSLPDLDQVFASDGAGELSPKRMRLLLRCLQFYVKSFPNKLPASQIDLLCKRLFDNTNSPPVKQLCLELVSDKSLLVDEATLAASTPGSSRKKARMSATVVEDRKQQLATPEAKKPKLDAEKTPSAVAVTATTTTVEKTPKKTEKTPKKTPKRKE
ncbi:hypothetical protein BASA81_007363 [Batrachochytrium salamandrivorans]|nr:hypothetical protein BASA81_007363 [Batrachochytrium salamandrivorans]